MQGNSRLGRLGSLSLAVAATVACTIHQTDTPSLSGPSELALSIGVSASPDSINQDGTSQSAIVVTARDASGKPISGLPLRLDLQIDGAPVDYGTLAAKNVVTGADGRAT